MRIKEKLGLCICIVLLAILIVYTEKITLPPQQDSVVVKGTDTEVPIIMTLISPKSKFTLELPIKLERMNNFDTILNVSEYSKETKMWGGKFERNMNLRVEYIEFDKKKVELNAIDLNNMFHSSFIGFKRDARMQKLLQLALRITAIY